MNVGNHPATIFAHQLNLLDDHGRSYSVDLDLTTAPSSRDSPLKSFWLSEDLQPSVPFTGFMAFRVAQDAQAFDLVISRMFEPDVRIPLELRFVPAP